MLGLLLGYDSGAWGIEGVTVPYEAVAALLQRMESNYEIDLCTYRVVLQLSAEDLLRETAREQWQRQTERKG